jgi:hypothetical protein
MVNGAVNISKLELLANQNSVEFQISNLCGNVNANSVAEIVPGKRAPI